MASAFSTACPTVCLDGAGGATPPRSRCLAEGGPMAITRCPGPEIAGLMYHEVTDDPRTSGFQRPGALPYTLSRSAFADHLNAIAGGKLTPELVSDLTLTGNGNAKHRHLVLTFDDGGASAMYVAEQLA